MAKFGVKAFCEEEEERKVQGLVYVQNVSSVHFVSTAAVVGDMLHTKPATTRNLKSVFPLQIKRYYLGKVFQITDLQLLSRPCKF